MIKSFIVELKQMFDNWIDLKLDVVGNKIELNLTIKFNDKWVDELVKAWMNYHKLNWTPPNEIYDLFYYIECWSNDDKHKYWYAQNYETNLNWKEQRFIVYVKSD